jgi:hypothetical protein
VPCNYLAILESFMLPKLKINSSVRILPVPAGHAVNIYEFQGIFSGRWVGNGGLNTWPSFSTLLHLDFHL